MYDELKQVFYKEVQHHKITYTDLGYEILKLNVKLQP